MYFCPLVSKWLYNTVLCQSLKSFKKQDKVPPCVALVMCFLTNNLLFHLSGRPQQSSVCRTVPACAQSCWPVCRGGRILHPSTTRPSAAAAARALSQRNTSTANVSTAIRLLFTLHLREFDHKWQIKMLDSKLVCLADLLAQYIRFTSFRWGWTLRLNN